MQYKRRFLIDHDILLLHKDFIMIMYMIESISGIRVSGTRIYASILLSKSISGRRFYDVYSGTRLHDFVFGILYLVLTFLVQALFVSPYHCQQSQQNILSNLKGISSPTHLLILAKNH